MAPSPHNWRSIIASGIDATATGSSSQATGVNSTATGGSSTASGDNSTTTGVNSAATAEDATAIGAGSTASQSSATALGANTSAAHQNSAAIGNGAATTRDDQIVYGTSTNTHTMAGVASDASLAAQGDIHGLVTTDANGKLASDGGALQRQVDDNTANINAAFKQIDENTQGIAIAMALGGLSLPEGKDFAVGLNLGFYDDKQAVAGEFRMRLNDTFSLNGGVGIGLNGSSKIGGRVGVSAAW